MREGQTVESDDIVQGHRAGDVLAQYLGTFSGQLNWTDGVVVPFTLEVVEQPDKPLRLSNVVQCRAHVIGQDATIHITTEDGALDHELAAGIRAGFPDASRGATTKSVLTLPWIGADDWGERLLERLPVDASRYEDPTVRLVVDWPSESPPRGGELMFYGTLVGTDLVDSIAVATLSF